MKLVKPDQLDTTNWGTWPIYYQVMVWVALFVVISLGYNRLVRADLLGVQNSNNQEIEKLEQKYTELYQYKVDLPLYQQKKTEMVDKLVSLLEYLPASTEMPSLIDEIYESAYKSNINFSSFTPEPSVETEYYNVEPISLKAVAGFANFASFMQYIGELPRVLNVSQFTLVIDEKNSSGLTLSSNLETYIYNQDINQFLEPSAKGGQS